MSHLDLGTDALKLAIEECDRVIARLITAKESVEATKRIYILSGMDDGISMGVMEDLDLALEATLGLQESQKDNIQNILDKTQQWKSGRSNV